MDAGVEALKDRIGIAADACSTGNLPDAGRRDSVMLCELSGACRPAFNRHRNGQEASGADVIGDQFTDGRLDLGSGDLTNRREG